MSLIQHKDQQVRYQQQIDNAREYVLPFVEQEVSIDEHTVVLDIGCGEGGVLQAFLEKGCSGVGIELDLDKSNYANSFLKDYLHSGKVEIVNMNIYEEQALEKFKGKFDIILLKDVIEHIPDQERFIPYLKKFLKPNGAVYFGFPPWYMPHGGHQQICENKFLSFLPYFHLLPAPIYKSILALFGESKGTIQELLSIKKTGISIERFERIVKKSGFTIALSTHFLINPIYKFKFGWKGRKQWTMITKLPFLRNFLTTCVYYVIRKEN